MALRGSEVLGYEMWVWERHRLGDVRDGFERE